MELSNLPLLSIIILFPVFGAMFVGSLKRENHEFLRYSALLFALISFSLSVVLYLQFDKNFNGFQFVEKFRWIDVWGISYYIGVDGINLLMIVLTTFLTPIMLLASWRAIEYKVKEFLISILLLEAFIIGTFAALNFFLFYVFWEAMLFPMFLLIGIWGSENRIYAALKLFLFTLLGSLFMLAAIIYLFILHYQQTGYYSMDFSDFYSLNLSVNEQLILFSAFALAFAVKVPLFPLHTWLPDAHVQAPTAGSVVLAGVLLKLGAYGFIRIAMPIFPEAVATFTPAIMIISTVGIIYGALVAMVQVDLKKLIAYSSISHMGYIILGLFVLNIQGVEGSILQMLNHGISTSALFLLVGCLYERRHTRLLEEYGGLAKVLPLYSTIFIICSLSSIAVPGTNGFTGEFLILVAVFKKAYQEFLISNDYTVFGYIILAASGMILGATYMLLAVEKLLFGPIKNVKNKIIKDLNLRELIMFLPLIILIFWIGLFPNHFLDKIDISVRSFISTTNR